MLATSIDNSPPTPPSVADDSTRVVKTRLEYLAWSEFSGWLQVETGSGQNWVILFYRGQICWICDGQQPNRFWAHQLQVSCPTIDLATLAKYIGAPFDMAIPVEMDVLWHYPAILGLLKEGTIDRPQLQKLLHGATKDLCFDILQYAHWRTLNYRSCAATFSFRPPVTIAVPEVLSTAIKVWDDWQERKLAKVSPRKAPHIRHPSRLYEQTEPAVYQGLVKAIDGTQSLRQMATDRKQDLLLLTRSLRRYFASRSIELTTLPDLPIPAPEEPQGMTAIVAEETYLIVSIDDSKQTCDIMEEIITGGGHRFIGINDPARALPVLIEHKPDMIFLDLIMPSINGYELCGQIRRVSRLANVPIVILTGRDGIVDRVRAKMVGATGFLSKPVNAANIDRAIAQYLVAADINSDRVN